MTYQQLQQCRFSRSVGAEQAEDGASRNVDRDGIDGACRTFAEGAGKLASFDSVHGFSNLYRRTSMRYASSISFADMPKFMASTMAFSKRPATIRFRSRREASSACAETNVPWPWRL